MGQPYSNAHYCYFCKTAPCGAAARDLAVKVLAAVEAEEVSRFGEGATGISSVVRDLFTSEGIELDATTQKGADDAGIS